MSKSSKATLPAAAHIGPKETASKKWTFGDWLGLLGGVVGLIGGVVSFLSWSEAKETRKIAAEAQALSVRSFDRATGKIKAKLKYTALLPAIESMPADQMRDFLGLGKSVHFDDLDQLLGTNPSIEVENSGDEAIDSLRIETTFVKGLIDVIGVPPEIQRRTTPWVTEQSKKEDYQLTAPLEPRQRARISIVRGLVAQMAQAQASDRADRRHLGYFDVRCYGRLVNATTYTEATGRVDAPISFVWLPKGFEEGRVKKLVETMQPSVKVITKPN